MDINNRRHLHAVAKDRLQNAPQAPKIALCYGGILAGVMAVDAGVTLLLDHMTSQLGGLSNLGTRSVLATIGDILPVLISFLSMALNLGFLNTMLRVSRRQFSSPQGLRMGFQRFWPMLKVAFFQSGLYCLATMASMYLSSVLYMFTPFNLKFNAIVAEKLGPQAPTEEVVALMADPVAGPQLIRCLVPLLVIILVISAVLCLIIAYYYRMTNFVIIDKPGIPALIAMGVSRRMMRHNEKKMLKLDFSMWWYYLSMAAVVLICCGGLILNILGVISMPPIAASLLFLALYLLGSLAVILFLRPHVFVSYSLAYDAIRPQEKPQEGAVLGNIFNM